MFLPGRLPMPTRDVDVWEHATLLFCEEGLGDNEMEKKCDRCMDNRIQALSFAWMLGVVLFHAGSAGCSSFYNSLISDFRVGGVSYFSLILSEIMSANICL